MKGMWKRAFALALAAAMTCSSFPMAVSAATDAKLLADFNFDNETSGFIGGEAKAAGSYTLTDSFTSENGKALYLNGNQFLTVTGTNGNLLKGAEEITVSYDAKPDKTGTSWVFYAAPNGNEQKAPEYYIGSFINNGNTKVERYRDGRTLAIDVATGSAWSHVDIVFAKNVTTVYVDGVKKQSVTNGNAQLPDILGDSGILQIGKANWTSSGEFYKGWIDNFKIYNAALTDADLVDSDAAAKAVDADKDALKLPEEVIGSFTLPSEGAKGSVITWTVEENDHAVIGADGYEVDVTRADDENKSVTFTATITMGSVSDTKEFTVVVKKNQGDADVVADALKVLAIRDSDAVRGNITLPTELSVEGTDKKVSITWTSSKSDVVTDEEVDGKAAGVVTRQPADTKVIMTATVTCGDVSDSKEIELTIKAIPKQIGDTTDYLFAYFTGSEGSVTDEQIYFSTSQDGSQWKDLTENRKPVLFSEIGDKGVRDPYLIRSPEGDRFFLIATDLSIYYRGGWGNAAATTTGSTNLVIWESDDLVNWTEPRLIDVAGPIPNAGCAWAPETMYDANTGNYVIYWATYSTKSNVNGDGMNMYYTTTRDFYTFTEPVLWIDRQNSIIDTTMIQVGDKYYRASGDGQITIEESDSIYEGWEIIGTLSGIFNNNRYSGSYLEGPEFFKYNEDDYLLDAEGNPVETWGLMCDQYKEGKGYLPFRTTDIADQTTKSWSPASDVNFGNLKKRHGTILPITRAEYNLVMEEIGKSAPVIPDVANTSALEAEIELCEQIDAAIYTEDSIEELQDALEYAKDLLTYDNVTQEEIDEAQIEIVEARMALEEIVEEPTPEPPFFPYEDVTDADWFYEAVYYTYKEGLMTGMDPTHFGPYGQLSRAQFALILFRMEGETAVETDKSFGDIAGDEWYGPAVLWAAENGIVTGYQDGNFGPADMITREQMAVMMFRYAKYLGLDVTKTEDYSSFEDAASVSEFASEAIEWAVGNGVITGKENGTLIDPQGNTARSEAAIIIQRFMGIK